MRIIRIFFGLALLLSANAVFAQELTDREIGFDAQRVAAKLKSRGYSEAEMKDAIQHLRQSQMDLYIRHNKEVENEVAILKQRNSAAENGASSSSEKTLLTPPCDVPPSERAALISLYNATNGPSWTNHTNWNTSAEVCNWYGVVVANGHVNEINLSSNNLDNENTVSQVITPFPDISALGELVKLRLGINHLKGNVDNFQNLIHLTALDIANNNFSGSCAPLSYLSSLFILNISLNNFSGDCAPLSQLTNLFWLDISANTFSNTSIPASFQNLNNLVQLNISSLDWGDTISDFTFIASHFPNLTSLGARNNNYSGALPSSMPNLSVLEYIDVANNNMTDISVLGSISTLKVIDFQSNEIATIPSSFSNLADLQTLDLGSNSITGSIPNWISSLSHLRNLILHYNFLEFAVPPMPASLQVLYISGNKFRFVDFASQYTALDAHIFWYDFQDFTDSPLTINAIEGATVTMKMSDDGINRYTPNDTFQWYRESGFSVNPSFPSANRILTMTNVSAADAGLYYCFSRHPVITDPSLTGQNLVLQRHPVTLNVTPATTPQQCGEGFEGTFPPAGWLVTDNGAQAAPAWESTSPIAHLGTKCAWLKPLNSSANQEWLIMPLTNLEPNSELVFYSKGTIGSNGSIYDIMISTSANQSDLSSYVSVGNVPFLSGAFEEKRIWLSGYSGPCYIAFVKRGNPPGNGAGYWFIDDVLVRRKDCPLPTEIYFSFINSTTTTLSWNANGASQWQVSYAVGLSAPVVVTASTNSITLPLASGNVYTIQIKALCPDCAGGTESYPLTTSYSPLCPYPTALTVTNMSSSSADISWTEMGQATSWNVQVKEALTGILVAGPTTVTSTTYHAILPNPNTLYQFYVQAICTPNDLSPWEETYIHDQSVKCTVNNPASALVKSLFLALLNDLHQKVVNGVTDFSIFNVGNYPQLAALAPYITDPNPGIYNFETEYANATQGSFSFQFSFANHGLEQPDVKIYNIGVVNGGSPLNQDNLVAYDFDTSEYFTPIVYLNDYGIDFEDGAIGKYRLRHINFCPDIQCISHVAIVVDESGSINRDERLRIRKQLEGFITHLAAANTSGSLNYVSLIGMSDTDDDIRTDHLLATQLGPVNSGNVNQYLDWINNYGTRYHIGLTGVSPSSDFWNSGLKRARTLSFRPDLVLMITDGAETANVNSLINTMKRFDNYRAGDPDVSLHPNGPHLYVVGQERGFYIDRDREYTDSRMLGEDDPNAAPQDAEPMNSNMGEERITPQLKKSLQYLLGYPDNVTQPNVQNVFPKSHFYYFDTADYYGHNDEFYYLGSDQDYFVNSLTYPGTNTIPSHQVVCGDQVAKDACDNCYAFQPMPDHDYILSAWVKEDLFEQVVSFGNAKITLIFYSDKEAQIQVGHEDFLPKGNIIDGWQRIVKNFKIPPGTVAMSVDLINGSESVPVYFDDIRIHPLRGSVKSFVYDPETFKLTAELDENNYSTFYEYDNEGGLVRVKKETAEGVKTIQETRSGNALRKP